MRYLFNHWVRISRALSQADKILLALDYDGTIAPIVSQPDKATLSLRMRKILKNVSGRNNVRVAVISGRSLRDVKGLVGIGGIFYAGNHGLEINLPGVRFVHPAAIKARPLLRKIKRSLQNKADGIGGVIFEDKGLVLALHYRRVDKRIVPRLKEIFESVFCNYSGYGLLDVGRGKQVWEIRPRTSWDKYSALQVIGKSVFVKGSPGLTIYIGDDLTDEDIFCRMTPKDISVYVGPPNNKRCCSRARYYLNGVSEVRKFIEAIDSQQRSSALSH